MVIIAIPVDETLLLSQRQRLDCDADEREATGKTGQGRTRQGKAVVYTECFTFLVGAAVMRSKSTRIAPERLEG